MTRVIGAPGPLGQALGRCIALLLCLGAAACTPASTGGGGGLPFGGGGFIVLDGGSGDADVDDSAVSDGIGGDAVVDAVAADAAVVDVGAVDAAVVDAAVVDVAVDAAADGAVDTAVDVAVADVIDVDATLVDGDIGGSEDAGDAEEPGDAGGETDTGASGPPSVFPGSGCKNNDGAKACSKDGKLRLECINGAWTPLSHCGFGVCIAKAAVSGPALLSCSVPLTTSTVAATACARFLPCFAPQLSMEACMRAALTPNFVAADHAGGSLADLPTAAMLGLANAAPCVAKTASCGQLAECLHIFPQPKCGSASGSGCDGAFAWSCTGGATLVGDCAALGVGCTVVAGAPVCMLDQVCAPGDVSLCAGTMAKACVTTPAGNRGAVLDCGALGLSCNDGVAVAASAASACGAAVACPAQAVPGCAGAMLTSCDAGKWRQMSCGSGLSCAYVDDTGLLANPCPLGGSCDSATCVQGPSCSHASRCEGTEVWYCEQGQPRRFDCKTVDKTCTGGAAPRCGS